MSGKVPLLFLILVFVFCPAPQLLEQSFAKVTSEGTQKTFTSFTKINCLLYHCCCFTIFFPCPFLFYGICLSSVLSVGLALSSFKGKLYTYAFIVALFLLFVAYLQSSLQIQTFIFSSFLFFFGPNYPYLFCTVISKL